MISFSDKHKAIFWHTHKTGGSYIEFILKRNYDFKHYDTDTHYLINEQDEPKEEKKEAIEKKEIIEKEEETEIIKEKNNQIKKLKYENYFLKHILSVKNTGDLGNKLFINEHQNQIGKIKQNTVVKFNLNMEQWREYFKFTFVRNPYDRAISSYEFIKQKIFDKRVNQDVLKDECTFTNFYKNQFNYDTNMFMHFHAYESQYTNLKNNLNDIQINYIAKYENINEEIIHILKKIGVADCTKHLYLISENLRINASQKKNLTEYFTEQALNTINVLFHEDFEHFGYEKFYNLDDLNNHLAQIKEKEENINKNLLKFYNYESQVITEEDIINSFL